MMDFLVEPERFAWLMELIVEFECDMMALVARRGFHGIHFADDWGTQNGLMISPHLWGKLFKPYYRRQFARAHELGLHNWFHCCGNFASDCRRFSRDRRGRAEYLAAERDGNCRRWPPG